MRRFWIFFLLLVLSCQRLVAYREGSMEWVVLTYSSALLQSDLATMRKYVARGVMVEDATRNPQTAALHVIRLCPQGGNEEGTRKLFVVLFGGRNDAIVHGLDVTVVREEQGWRIQNARLSVDSYGAPRAFLRNCQIDMRLSNF